MSGILDDLIKTIEQEEAPATSEVEKQNSMFSHSEQFEKYAKGENIGVADDKGK